AADLLYPTVRVARNRARRETLESLVGSGISGVPEVREYQSMASGSSMPQLSGTHRSAHTGISNSRFAPPSSYGKGDLVMQHYRNGVAFIARWFPAASALVIGIALVLTMARGQTVLHAAPQGTGAQSPASIATG